MRMGCFEQFSVGNRTRMTRIWRIYADFISNTTFSVIEMKEFKHGDTEARRGIGDH